MTRGTKLYALVDIDLARDHWKRQPRAPRGAPGGAGGQWVGAGGALRAAAKEVTRRLESAAKPENSKKREAMQRMARALTNKELQRELRTGSPDAKAVARIEAARRIEAAQESLAKKTAPKFEARLKPTSRSAVPTPDRPAGKVSDAEVASKAKRVMAKAKVAEPGITGSLKRRIGKGEFAGFEHRLKAADSLQRKIKTDAELEFGGDVLKAAENVKDAVRYTALYSEADLADGAQSMLDGLRRDGFKVRKVKNYLEPPPEGPLGYRGVNVQMIAPDGHNFELQFHTQKSLDAKFGKGHKIYEDWRVLPPEDPQAKKLEQESRAFYASMVAPVPGARKIH